MVKDLHYHHPNSGDRSFTSDWKSSAFWTHREQLQVWIGQKDGYIHVQMVTQGLAARFFSALLQVITFGRIKTLADLGKKVTDYYAIKMDLTEQQQQLIARIITQKTLSLPHIKKELNQSLFASLARRVKPSPVLPSQVISTPIEVPIITSEQTPQPSPPEPEVSKIEKPIHEDGTVTKKDIAAVVQQAIIQQAESPPVPPEPPTLEGVDSGIGLGDLRRKSDLQQIAAVKTPTRDQIVEWVESIEEDLSNVIQKEAQQASLLSRWYNPLPSPVYEEDNADLAFMQEWEETMRRYHAQLQQLSARIDPNDSLTDRMKSLKNKLEGFLFKFEALHTYFKKCESLDLVIERAGDQLFDISSNRQSFNADNYRALIEQITVLERLPDFISNIDERSKEKLRRKCQYQVSIGLNKLEDLMEGILENLKSEIPESHAHLNIAVEEALKGNPQDIFKHLQKVYEAHLCLKTLHNDIRRFEKLFKTLNANPLLSKTCRERILSDSNKWEEIQQSMRDVQDLTPYIQHFFDQCSNLPLPKAILDHHFQKTIDAFTAVPPDETATVQAEYSLAALEFIGKRSLYARENHPEFCNFVKNLGKKAAEFSVQKRSAPNESKRSATIRSNRPVLTTTKKNYLEEQQKLFKETPYSPMQRKALSIFINYLRLWDVIPGPLMSKIITPVGRRNADFHLKMMEKTVKNKAAPNVVEMHDTLTQWYLSIRAIFYKDETYPDHFQQALASPGADPDFVQMYDKFLRGEITYKQPFGVSPQMSEAGESGESDVAQTSVCDPTWAEKFFGTDSKERHWANASEWEKWSYYHLYPIMRDHYFDQMVHTFAFSHLPEPSQESPQEHFFHYYLYKIYESARDPQGQKALNSFLAKAHKIPQYNNILNEYHRYILDRREAFQKPIAEVPLTTMPLAKEVLKGMARDAETLVREVDEHIPKDAVSDPKESWHTAAEGCLKAFEELTHRMPPELADRTTVKNWLNDVQSFRENYDKTSQQIRSAVLSEKWKDEISLEKLKAFMATPPIKIDQDTLAQMLARNRPLQADASQSKLETLYQEALDARIALLKSNPLCTEKQQAEFCRDYLNNSDFTKQTNNEQLDPAIHKESSRFAFESQLKALHDYNRHHAANYAHVNGRQMMEEARAHFASKLQEWLSQGIVNTGEIAFAHQVLTEIAQSLQQAKITAQQQLQVERTFELSKVTLPNKLTVTNLEKLPYTSPNVPTVQAKPLKEPSPYFRIPVTEWQPLGSTFAKQMRSILDGLKQTMPLKTYLPGITLIEDFISKIPLNDEQFWKEFDGSREEAIHLLKDLLIHYTAFQKNKRIDATQRKILAIAHKLYRKRAGLERDFPMFYGEFDRIYFKDNFNYQFEIPERALDFYEEYTYWKKLNPTPLSHIEFNFWVDQHHSQNAQLDRAVRKYIPKSQESSTIRDKKRALAVCRKWETFILDDKIKKEMENAKELAKLPQEFFDLYDIVFYTLYWDNVPTAVTIEQQISAFEEAAKDTGTIAYDPRYLNPFSIKRESALPRGYISPEHGVNLSPFMNRVLTHQITYDREEGFTFPIPTYKIKFNAYTRTPFQQQSELAESLAKEFHKPESLMREILAVIEHAEGQAQRAHHFFTKHMELLHDNDFQDFLRFTLLNPLALGSEFEKAPKDNQKFVDDLAKFCREAYMHYTSITDFTTSGFILEVNSYLKRFVEGFQNLHNDTFERDFTPKFLNSRQELLTFINDPRFSPLKIKFNYQLLTNFITEPITSATDAITFVSVFIEYKLEMMDSAKDSAENLEKTKKLLAGLQAHRIRNSEMLEKLLAGEERDVILNAVYQHFYPGMPLPIWKTIQTFPHFSSADGRVVIDLEEGMIHLNGIQSSPISEGLLEDESLKEIFKEKIKIAAKVSEGAARLEIYQLIGPAGRDYRLISNPNGKPIIQTKFENSWYELVRDPSNQALLGLGQLAESHYIWHQPNPSALILTDKASGAVKYATVAAADKNTNHLSVMVDGERSKTIVSGIDHQSPLKHTIQKFEDPSKTLILQDEQTEKISAIQFPRYGLEFVTKQIDGESRAVCSKYEGYYLAKDQHIPILGSIKHYIVLEKRKPSGEVSTLVVMPQVSLQRDGEANFQSSKGKLLSFEVDKGHLKPTTEEANFYLAMIQLWNRDYQGAYKSLNKQISQIEAYSPAARSILEWLTKLEFLRIDEHPQAIAVHLKAHAMLLKDQIDFAKKDQFAVTWTDERQLLDMYLKYLQMKPDCVLVPLSREEERLIITTCQLEIDAVLDEHKPIVQRMHELHMTLTEEISYMSGFEQQMGTKDRDLLHFSSLRMQSIYPLRTQGIPFENELFERYRLIANIKNLPWNELKDFTYKLANEEPSIFTRFMSRDALINKLRDVLQQLQKGKSEKEMFANLLLEAVLVNPENFPKDLEWFFRNHPRPREYFREHVFYPLRKWVLTDQATAPRFDDLPKVKHPVSAASKKTVLKTEDVTRPQPSGHPLIPLPVNKMPLPLEAYLKVTPVDDGTKTNRMALWNSARAFCDEPVYDNMAQLKFKELRAKVDEVAEKEVLPPTYNIIDLTTLQNARKIFENESIELESQLKTLQLKIETIANRSSSLLQRILRQARILAGLESKITLPELIQNFLRSTPLADNVKHLVKNYLVTATHLQRVNHLAKLQGQVIDAIARNAPSLEVQELVKELGIESTVMRSYDIDKHPEYLVIEYYLEVLLRPKQIETLDLLKIKDGVITQPQHMGKVVELPPGSGKSYLLLPILGWLNADGKHTAITVIPKALIPSTIKALRDKMGKAMNQMLDEMTFDSDTRLDLPALKRYLERIKAVRDEKKVLLMSSESIKSLFLNMPDRLRRYLAVRDKHVNIAEIRNEISVLFEIHKIFKQSGVALFDEWDAITDVLRSFHFALGQPKELSENFKEANINLYRYLATKPDLRKALRQSTDGTYKGKDALIRDLISGRIHKNPAFQEFLNQNSDNIHLIQQYLEGSDDAAVMAFMRSIPNEDIQDALSIYREQINELLVLTFSKNLFEHFGPSDAKPGSDEEFQVKPYDQSMPTPEGTRHGTKEEITNYTCQMYLEMGVPTALVERLVIDKIKQEINTAIVKKQIQDPTKHELYKFLVHLNGDARINPFSMSETQLEDLTRNINKDPQKILDVVFKFVLPLVKDYTKQLNANAQVFAAIFHMIQGYAGLLWNSDTYNKMISSITTSDTEVRSLTILLGMLEDPDVGLPIVNLQTPLTDSSIRNALKQMIADCQGPCSLIDVANLLRGAPRETVSKIWFELGQEKNWSKKGVGFYDDKTQKLMVATQSGPGIWKIEELADTPLTKDDILMYYDQAHTVGADVALSVTMIGKMPVGRHTTSRDETQGKYRLRGIEKSQKVFLTLTSEDEQYIESILEQTTGRTPKGKVNKKDFIRYAKIIQSRRQGSDNYISFKQKMQAIVMEKALSAIYSASTVDEAADIYSVCSELFESEQETRSFILYGQRSLQKPETTHKALTPEQHKEIQKTKKKRVQDEVEAFLQGPLVKAFKEHPLLNENESWAEIEREVRKLARDEIGRLPDILPPSNEYNRERNIQTQQQQQTETNTQMETHVEVSVEVDVDQSVSDISGPLPRGQMKPYSPWSSYINRDLFYQNKYTAENNETPFTWMPKVLEEDFPEVAPAFSANLRCSLNLCRHQVIPVGGIFGFFSKKDYSYKDLVFHEDRNNFDKLLIAQNKETGRTFVVMINSLDEIPFRHLIQNNVKEKFDVASQEMVLGLYDLTTGMIMQSSNTERIDAATLETQPEFQSLKIQAKFFQGEIDYSDAELKVMEEWLTNCGVQVEKMIDFFKTRILKWNRTSLKEFAKSDLARLFKKLTVKALKS